MPLCTLTALRSVLSILDVLALRLAVWRRSHWSRHRTTIVPPAEPHDVLFRQDQGMASVIRLSMLASTSATLHQLCMHEHHTTVSRWSSKQDAYVHLIIRCQMASRL